MRRRIARGAAAVAVGLGLASGGAAPALAAGTVQQALERAKAFCEDLDGRFSVGEGAVGEVNLGPGRDAETGDRGETLDYSKLTCEGAWSAFCGSGGCMLRVQVGRQAWEWQVEGWSMVELEGFPVLMLVRDGGWCGGAGAQICFETLKWDGQRFLTVGPEPDPAE
ncbi:hypothetical protein P2H44_07705 [Albimonas sp. CAU 1670]|uniref:hypothetical protein n=1 Tax=Albimonas sp. CAU 1670 TaxID=3032599 RepID=UPI0023DABA46|nr:hypothetical protein [Albimonas sp. CAU 1670]MDF2232434.1 hypothetical protein [Albimonas sp. CAU 1670]